MATKPGTGVISYRNDVASLITLDTPHLGTPIPFILDNLTSRYVGITPESFWEAVGIAAWEVATQSLAIGSPSLSDLNNLDLHPLPSDIAYTSLISTGGTPDGVWFSPSHGNGDGIVATLSQDMKILPNAFLRVHNERWNYNVVSDPSCDVTWNVPQAINYLNLHQTHTCVTRSGEVWADLFGLFQPPTVTLSAVPSSILPGQSAALSWASSRVDSCAASGAWAGGTALGGSVSVSPIATATYTLRCFGSGGVVSASTTVSVGTPAAPVVFLSATPTAITAGGTATLGWASSNATSCTASGGWSGARALNGSVPVSPSSTTTYVLSCTGPGGTRSDDAIVTVGVAPPAVAFIAVPETIVGGDSSTLFWAAANASSCTASGGWSGSQATTGNLTISPTGTTTYNLSCTGPQSSLRELISNGAFSGVVNEWSRTGSFWADFRFTNCNSCPGYAYLSLENGAPGDNLIGGLSQVVSLPADASDIVLSFWARITTNETTTTTAFDLLKVTLHDTSGNVLYTLATLSNLNASSSYQRYSYNVPISLRGQSVRIHFLGTTDAGLPTVFRVDDVSVQATVPTTAIESVTVTVLPPPSAVPDLYLVSNPSSITSGEGAMLSWESANVTSCAASNGWSGGRPTSGSEFVAPLSTSTFSLTCQGPGGTVTRSADVTVSVPPPIVSVTASPPVIAAGSSTTVNWRSVYATSCSALGAWSGPRSTSGSEVVAPPSSTTYTLSCSGPGGTNSAAASLTVVDTYTLTTAATPANGGSISRNPDQSSYAAGTQVTLTANAEPGYRLSGWSGCDFPSGMLCVMTMNANRSVMASFSFVPPPSVSILVDPATTLWGGSTRIEWSATDANACTAFGAWSGARATSGYELVVPSSSSSYGISCAGPGGGPVEQTVQVNARSSVVFRGLGHLDEGNAPGSVVSSQALAVSADGSAVAGVNSSIRARRAFLWTRQRGLESLGNLYLQGGSEAYGISADGSVVVGASDDGNSEKQAFRWTRADGMIGLGRLFPGQGYSEATGVSDDGSTVVGTSITIPEYEYYAFRWTTGAGMQWLGDFGATRRSGSAQATSADGSAVVGIAYSPVGGEAFRWRPNDGLQSLGFLPAGNPFSKAYAVTPDGSTIVGVGQRSGLFEPFRWTPQTGMLGLGHLAGGGLDDQATGVSGDGSFVVGTSHGPAGLEDDEAFVWDTANGSRRLASVLTDNFGIDLAGWTLEAATAISRNGTVIAGYGMNPQGMREAWVVGSLLPDVDDDGIADAFDNCTLIPNFAQLDTNQDGYGNICDADYDNDGVVGLSDFGLFKQTFGASQGNPAYNSDADADGDGGVGLADFGRLKAQFGAPPGPSGVACAYFDQTDTDGDGISDACDVDDDNDTAPDSVDNCILVPNLAQLDTNQDGYGNICDADYDNDGVVGLSDFGLFKQTFGASQGNPAYNSDADADGDGGVGLADFGRLKAQFGAPPGPSGVACVGAPPCLPLSP